MNVPTSLLPSATLKKNREQLYKALLQPLNCSFGVVTTRDEPRSLRQLVKAQARTQKCDVVVVFAIRRPGCANCREHGLQLTAIAKQLNVAMMGTVKERGVAAIDENLCTMYKDYFRFPIFQDEKWNTYYAMGGRKMTVFQLVMGHLKANKRYMKKNVENTPFGGDLLMQGGLLIFNKRGQLKYCYEENYGEELDTNKLRAAIKAIREEHSESTSHCADDDTLCMSTASDEFGRLQI